jgi:nucleoside-diphosphate-sugar epimerase
MKRVIVLGCSGFIGGHLARRLKQLGYWVRGVDVKCHEFFDLERELDEFCQADLRCQNDVAAVIDYGISEVYQLAADMGGVAFIDPRAGNDFDIMTNSALINLNVIRECVAKRVGTIFLASSACIYPEINQLDPQNPRCDEASGRTSPPDTMYGWEKLFAELVYEAAAPRIDVRIARFHNIFGPYGTYKGGREKAPAALCRKVLEAPPGGEVEIWGGAQTRSFLYVDECVDGVLRLMESDFQGPVNIGSEEMISIREFTQMIIEESGKQLTIKSTEGPIGVQGRNSDNRLIRAKLGWAPSQPLREGVRSLLAWMRTLD